MLELSKEELNNIRASTADRIYKEIGFFFYCEDGQVHYCKEEGIKKEL